MPADELGGTPAAGRGGVAPGLEPEGREGDSLTQESISGALSSLSADELKLLALREKRTQQKRVERARKATEHADRASQPNPGGYLVPPMPAGLGRIRKWYRQQHDAFSRRELHATELKVCADSMRVLADSYRASADLRRAKAMERTATAQERMADVLASVEHGGAAVFMLQQMREGLADGKRRPLPGRPLAMVQGRPDGEPAA